MLEGLRGQQEGDVVPGLLQARAAVHDPQLGAAADGEVPACVWVQPGCACVCQGCTWLQAVELTEEEVSRGAEGRASSAWTGWFSECAKGGAHSWSKMLRESAVPTFPFFRAASSCSRLAAAAS